MADNILRLKVESSEYDAKLKKAAEGIQHLADVAHRGGGELTGLEKAELDYIKSLGTMETKSRTAAGSVRELENTYKELKVIYDQLNEVEKADEGGKALAASLETLKQRAQDARASLDNASKSLNDNGQSAQQSGSILESLAGKFTLNIDALKLFDMGLSVTKAALDVAKDAFFASEANVDEWGRTVAASQSLYEGFLTAINNGDISGYLNNIDSIVNAARLAYDELDKLGTMKTIQAPKMSAQQTENERLRMMIQTGRYIAPIDGRKPSMKDGQLLTPAQIKTLERQLQNGMQSVVKLVGNEVKQTGKAIDAYYNSIAKQNGMSLQEFKKGTSSWDEFSKKMQGYQQYQKWRQENSFTDMYGNRQVREGNPYQEFKKWGTFRVDKMGENSFNDLVRLIQQRDQQAGQAYSMQSQAYRTMNRAEGVTVRQIMGGTGGKGGKGGTSDKNLDDEQKVQQKINDLLKEALTADANRQGEIRQQVAELQKQQEKYKDIKNIAQGILPKDKEAVFTIDGKLTEETKKALSDIKGVTIDDKSLTITANTSDALKALQGIEGVTIDPKTVTITATDEALPKLREIQGITIDDKTMTVTAETADALRALQGIDGVTIAPKTVTITATDEAMPKLREIQGISIDDKTMTVTAETQEAMQKVQELIGDVTEIKLMPIKPVITDDDIDKLLRKQYGQAIEVPVTPKMSAGDELVQSIRLDLAQSIQETDMQTLRTLLEAQIKNGIEGVEIPANSIIDQIFGEGADIPDEYWQNLQDQINEKLKEMGIDPINIDFSTGKAKDDKGSSDNEFKEFNAKAGQFISGLANVSNGLKGLGLQLPEGVDQLLGAISSVMQVIQGVNTVISVFSASAMTSNTAAIIANTAALYANSFLSVFANGGIAHAANGWSGTVPGTSYSGDNIPIMVNSGELILNRAQQGNIASQLEGGGLGDLQLELRVDAEELIIMLNNNGKRRGLGRLING